MSELARHHDHREALHAVSDRGTATRYGEAINRYLGGAGESGRPAAAPAVRTDGLIVVGADDTPAGSTAVDHAAIEADLRGWNLRMVHVLGPSGRRSGRDAGTRLLERLTDRVHACAPSVPVSSRLVAGSAPALLSYAEGSDLVVVGHRHQAAGAFGTGVGDRVAAGHRGTVLVVRMPGWPPSPDFGQRPIVVGVDHARSPAAAFAMEEARVRGCEVVMLHAGSAAERTDRLDIVGGIHVHHRNVAGDPAAALLAASGSAAALVVGRTGITGVPGSLGSVSRTMVQRAPCPVFLVG
jgi:nucleotide-binding universal stress UspA family protein